METVICSLGCHFLSSVVQSPRFITDLMQAHRKAQGMTKRSSEDWVLELRGDCGREPQRLACQDLANYSYIVAYNYLRLRQADLRALADFAPEEMAALAQDFVQESLEKLARNDFTLLAKYSGAGKFTSWAAQVVRNQAAMELRKSYWTRRTPIQASDDSEEDSEQLSPTRDFVDTSGQVDPAQRAQQQQVQDILQRCLAKLPERNRLAIVSCIADDVRAESVAQTLNTTANAVYLLIARGKRQLKECLLGAGLSRDVLSIFEIA